MKTNISVVVPIYNAKDYLRQTIDSLLNQSFEEFELLCVDDCSEDGTKSILESLAQIDKRVKIYRNKNRMGAAYSRNFGLKNATGEYIIFLDSDDYFEKTLLEESYNTIKEYDLDICLFDCKLEQKSNGIKKMIWESSFRNSEYANKVFDAGNIKTKDINLFLTAPWNKMYKRQFIEDNKLLFQSLSSSNDVAFSITSYMLAKRMKALETDRPLIVINSHDGENRITNNRKSLNEFLAANRIVYEARKRCYDKRKMELIFIKVVSLLLAQFTLPEGSGEYYSFLNSEGIQTLYESGGDLFDKIAKKYNHPLKYFLSMSFESGWYRNIDIFLLNQENKLWEEWDNNKKIAIWGAGNYGKKLVFAARANQKEISGWLDSDESKVGKEIMGVIVQKASVSEVANYDVVIIAIKNIDVNYIEKIHQLGICVRSLGDYI